MKPIIAALVPLACSLTFGSGLGAAELPVARTEHTVRIDGEAIDYVATAGRLPIRDMESGEIRGRMFYVAFRVLPEKGRQRPVFFSWGGGPSGPSLGVQMVYGPRTIAEDGKLIDNQNSLLREADLVFVDPIGTGFSRPEHAGYLDEFYSTVGDARSVAEFVRVWLATNSAEDAPLLLNGQSYGVWRAAFVAQILEQNGRRVAGVLITSGGTGMADEYLNRSREIAYRVPDYAAAALVHGTLGPGLPTQLEELRRRAESWVGERYAPALERIGELSDSERQAIAGELARFTGFPADRIDLETLVFTPRDFLGGALGEGGQRLDNFDMREIRTDDPPDPDSAGLRGRIARTQSRYLREHLAYVTDLAYIGYETGYTPVTSPDYTPPGWRWQYDSGLAKDSPAEAMAAAQAGGGPPGREPWIMRALESNPKMQVFVGAGMYDFCAANEERKRNMPPDIADNFSLHCYLSGHGIYRDADTYPLLIGDMREFIRQFSP